MPRRATEFQTIRSEGGLLPPDLLRRIVDPAGKVSGVEPTAYGLPAGERINEAITQSWNRLRRHWAEFRASAKDLPAGDATTGLTNDKWSLPLMRELGFGFLATTAGPTIDGKTYAISRFAGATPIHLVGCGVDLDRRAAGVRGAAAGNPHGLVQEFLNRSPGHLWAILSNGLSFRILRDNQALSRQSFLEFDLAAMFDGEVYSDFVLLWLVAHASRFLPREDGRPNSCWLETWSKEAAEQGVAALTDLRGGVEKALEILGQGFVSHPRNTALRDALRKGEVKLSDFHHQLLRVVYRLIFLFVAEDRELEGIPILHPQDKSDAARLARERYASHYSTSRLRELASRIKGSRHGDLWRQFQLLVGGLSGEARFAAMSSALALPPLGSMLWNPSATTLLNGPGLGDPGAELSNHDFLEALRHLAFIRKEKILRPVDYKNLGSEEFGGVYESFLALTPQISSDGARFTFAEFAGNERKTSGSYYTPDSLVQCLLDSALDPVVEARLADAERLAKMDWAAVEKEIQSDPAKRTYVLAFLTKHAGDSKTASSEERKRAWDSVPPAPRRWKLSEESILAIKVCDMACGSGHFLVGAGHRLARHLARVRALAAGESEPSPLLYQHALRDVIGHCLYGVDINPMAVELCKVTLWLEALEPGKPLSFLDHHIRCGNSLLGATPELIAGGLPDETFDAIEGDDKAACSSLKKLNRAQREGLRHLFLAEDNAIRDRLRQTAAAIDEMGDGRPEDIQRKEAAFRAEQSNYDFQKAWDLANLWCAAFVIEKQFPVIARRSTLDDSVQAVMSSAPNPTQTGLFGSLDGSQKPKKKQAKAPTRAGSEDAIGITTQYLRDFAAGRVLPDGLIIEVRRLAEQYNFFHWHLAFLEVFMQGGFDVSLGNPPWERLKFEDKKWFAVRAPDIAESPSAIEREKKSKALSVERPQLAREYLLALRQAQGESHFIANSGRFVLVSGGDINTYAVFAESAISTITSTGRVGMIVPSAITSTLAYQPYIAELVAAGKLVSYFDFENKAFFPDVDSRYRFCLLTVGGGHHGAAKCGFLLHSLDELTLPDRILELRDSDLALLSPNTKAFPVFQSRRDAAIVRHVYSRIPILSTDTSTTNPWGVNIYRMIDATESEGILRDDKEFQKAAIRVSDDWSVSESGICWLRVYEGKMVDMYNHRFASSYTEQGGQRSGKALASSSDELSNPNYSVRSRYWVKRSTVDSKLQNWQHKWLLTFMNVCSATNERTMIPAIIPLGGATKSLRLVIGTRQSSEFVGALYANLASFAFDYVVRQSVSGLNLSEHIVKQLPIIAPADYLEECKWDAAGVNTDAHSPLIKWLLPRVLELTYTAWDLRAFAQDSDWAGPPFRWDEERRFLLRCELDAAFFHLYLGSEEEWRKQPAALTQSFPTPRDAVAYIMDTFPIVKRKDEEKFNGDYRTKRTILEIYDAMAKAVETGQPFQTRLSPPPADPSCCHAARKISIPAPHWMDQPLVLPSSRRVALPADRYRAALVPHLLFQAGGSIPFERFRKAYWLLTEPKVLERFASGAVGTVARAWARSFTDELQKDLFIHHLKGAMGRQLHFVRKGSELWLELRDTNVADDEHIVFDARLALLVADLWPASEPFQPLSAAEESVIRELEAVS